MSTFLNKSNRQRAIDNTTAIGNKQDAIGYQTNLSVGSLNSAGQVGGVTLKYHVGGSGLGAEKNVETEINALANKLNSATTIFTDAASNDYTLSQLLTKVVDNKAALTTFTEALNGAIDDPDSQVVSLMEQVSANKAAHELNATAISSLETDVGAIAGDISSAVAQGVTDAAAYTDQEVSAEALLRADIATELTTHISTYDTFASTTSSALTARASDVQDLAAGRHIEMCLEAEGGHHIFNDNYVPFWSLGQVPVSEYFGIPMPRGRELVSAHYVARQPAGAMDAGMSMTVSFKVRDTDGATEISSVDKTFAGGVASTTFAPVTIAAGQSLEVLYTSRVGQPDKLSRYRMVLTFRETDLDSLGA
jgi:hypothetical protein